MTVPADRGPERREEDLATEELARRAGVRPTMSVAELAEPDAFESDEELGDFLADLYASRRASLG